MKPEKSPKLKGSWLRELNRIQSICRKTFDFNLIFNKAFNYYERSTLVELDDDVFFTMMHLYYREYLRIFFPLILLQEINCP